jgi:zinc and cadmium transporter
LISSISLVGVFFLAMTAHTMRSLLFVFVSVAVGALLGDAFIHLLPEATEALGAQALWWALGGMGIFFVLEKFLHWHHHHEPHGNETPECDDCHEHIAPFGKLVIISDVLHNIIDGVIIAAAFLLSPAAGIATTIAVALHELPQEIGDFGVLLHAGYSRTKALFANFASALSAFMGAAIVFIVGTEVTELIPIFSALAAGAFIYIATVDLVPELHRAPRTKETLLQLIAILCGVGAMVGLTFLEHSEVAANEQEPIAHERVAEPVPPPQAPTNPPYTVTRVIDGDTIEVVREGETARVRLLGIDAPETYAGTNRSPECYAENATQALSSILPLQSTITLENDPTQEAVDTYGRLLAYVFIGDTNINKSLIEQGAAREYTYRGQAYQWQRSFQEAESSAQRAGEGLWAACR